MKCIVGYDGIMDTKGNRRRVKRIRILQNELLKIEQVIMNKRELMNRRNLTATHHVMSMEISRLKSELQREAVCEDHENPDVR